MKGSCLAKKGISCLKKKRVSKPIKKSLLRQNAFY